MIRIVAFASVVFASSHLVASGSVKAYFCNTRYGSSVVLENNLVRITIADSGGKVTGWYIKSLNKDIALWDQSGGYAVLAQRLGVFDDTTCR